jgi:hypothetical protein
MSAGFFASRLHVTPLLSQVHLRVVRMIASSANEAAERSETETQSLLSNRRLKL